MRPNFIFIWITKCGYTPMNTKINDQNFNIINLDIEGDQQISSSIKRGLERYAKNKKQTIILRLL